MKNLVEFLGISRPSVYLRMIFHNYFMGFHCDGTSKNSIRKLSVFLRSQYVEKQNMYLGTMKLVPSPKHIVSIAQNTAEAHRYEIQLHNEYGTFENKDQCEMRLSLGGLYHRVSDGKEWLPTFIE